MLKKILKFKVLAVILLLAAFPFVGAFACPCEKADDWYSVYTGQPDQNAGINDYSTSTYQYDYKTQTKVNVDKTVDPTMSNKNAKTNTMNSSSMSVVEANDADTGSGSSDSAPYDNYPN